MLISKVQFAKIINRLKETDEIVEKVNNIFNNSAEAIRSDYMNVGALMICHEDLVVELLEKMFEDEYSYITYWLYELNYGRAYKAGCIKEANGKDIDISTAEKLYDFLIKNMKEKNK